MFATKTHKSLENFPFGGLPVLILTVTSDSALSFALSSVAMFLDEWLAGVSRVTVTDLPGMYSREYLLVGITSDTILTKEFPEEDITVHFVADTVVDVDEMAKIILDEKLPPVRREMLIAQRIMLPDLCRGCYDPPGDPIPSEKEIRKLFRHKTLHPKFKDLIKMLKEYRDSLK